VDSLLAGGNVNRALIDMPAWQKTGPLAWAGFGRHADLSRRAMALYPLEAFSGVILSIAAVLSFRRDATSSRSASIPLYGAAALGVAGLLTTARAAPIMLSVRGLGESEPALQRALDGFQFWGNIRGAFQVLAFVANLWSLVVLSRADRA